MNAKLIGFFSGFPTRHFTDSIAEVLKKDIGYFSWIMQGDFTLNTKNVLTKIRLRETGLIK